MGPNTVCIWTDLNRVRYAIYYAWLLVLVNHTRTHTHVLVLVRTILAIAHTRGIHACDLARVDQAEHCSTSRKKFIIPNVSATIR